MKPKPYLPRPHPNRNKFKFNQHRHRSSSAPNLDSDPILLIPNFPDELAIEILSRLPAKSLLKFRCVSKPWRSLISSSRFVKTHLAMAAGRDDYEHHSLILTVDTPYDDSPDHDVYSVSSLLNAPVSENPSEITPEFIELQIPAPQVIDNHHHLTEWTVVVGSCNGMVCIYSYSDKHFIFWNPCIKKSKRLPWCGMEQKFAFNNASSRSTRVGFGYDELNDDYKLVGLFYSSREPAPMMKVYSLKNGSWSDSKAVIPRDMWYSWDNLQFLSGKLHWFDTFDLRIGSFDLTNETYEEVDCTTPENDILSDESRLVVLGGCLSLCCDYWDHTDIWVMKEYGVKESWTKLVSIPYVPLFVNYSVEGKCRTQPICLLRSGEILYVLGTALVIYNPKKMNTIRWFPGIGQIATAIMYVKTLVSPIVIN